MKKLIVAGLAIYGGVKLVEKVVDKYGDRVERWAKRKIRKGLDRVLDDIFNEETLNLKRMGKNYSYSYNKEAKASRVDDTKQNEEPIRDGYIDPERPRFYVSNAFWLAHHFRMVEDTLANYDQLTLFDLGEIFEADVLTKDADLGWKDKKFMYNVKVEPAAYYGYYVVFPPATHISN